MKRIFSTLLLIIKWPINLLKKTKIDNFIGGLIFGAIFSLFVNIFTLQIQETVQKQRVFEALEHEIVGNLLSAKQEIQTINDKIKDNENPNFFYTVPKYSERVWNTSEAMKYIVQLKPEIQAKLELYYQYDIEKTNLMADKNEQLMQEILKDCYFNVPESKKESCRITYYQLLNGTVTGAEMVFDSTYNLMKLFHPTQDRLNSFFLKLLLGSESMVILQGEKPSK